MKKIIFVLLAATMLFGCQKKATDTTPALQDVSINATKIIPETGREDWECKDEDPTHAWVQILLDGASTPTSYYLELFSVGGNLYTQSIKLAIGSYQVVQFIMYQETNGIQGIQATDIVTHGTPIHSSEYASYVNFPLPISFVVAAFEKAEIPIEVLCFIDANYAKFGFEWFEITITEPDQFCFFGDICLNSQPFAPADFEPEYGTGLGVNIAAIMEIIVKKDGVQTAIVNNTSNQSEPLCVPYYEDPDVPNEVYTFELYLWLPDEVGFSYQLYHTYTSTDGILDVDMGDDLILDFVVGTCGYGEADQTFDFIWSPPVPPLAGELIITEIMANPAAVGDSDGEWFEVYNTTDLPIEMEGLIIRDNDTDTHTIVGSLVIQPFSFVILGINDDPNTNGGVSVDYEYTGITLAQGVDEVVIELDASTIIDQVSYDDGLTFPDPNGASMSLDPDEFDGNNNDGANWCEATSSYGDGDLGTPRDMNDACTGSPATIGLVITEIMCNPSGTEPNGEWFEVYNNSNIDIDMIGMILMDNIASHTINTSLIVPSHGYKVFGINGNTNENGGVALDYVYSDLLLSNSGDEVVIKSALGEIIDMVIYASSANGKSRSLDPDFLTWCNSSTVTFGDGDYGTPGIANVACP